MMNAVAENARFCGITAFLTTAYVIFATNEHTLNLNFFVLRLLFDLIEIISIILILWCRCIFVINLLSEMITRDSRYYFFSASL